MVKIVTVGLVVIMLVVGFAVGLIASPLIMPQDSVATDTVWEQQFNLGKKQESGFGDRLLLLQWQN